MVKTTNLCSHLCHLVVVRKNFHVLDLDRRHRGRAE
jgi:hypothetical protein